MARRHAPKIIALAVGAALFAGLFIFDLFGFGGASTAAIASEDDSIGCTPPSTPPTSTTPPTTSTPPTGVQVDPRAVVAAQAARGAGFLGEDLVIAVAVAGAESGWVADVIGGPNGNGSYDYGLWQINSVHEWFFEGGDWADPAYNASGAYRIWSEASGWIPWVTFNTGAYLAYMDRARAAVAAAGGSSGECGSGGPPIGDVASLRDRAEHISFAINLGMLDPYYHDRSDYYRMCAKLAARIHSHSSSGWNTALIQWNTMVLQGEAHAGDTNYPPGANLFWNSGGTQCSGGPCGHVAVGLDNLEIVSNDIHDGLLGITGGVYITTFEDIQNGSWHFADNYLGWAPPIYNTPVDPGELDDDQRTAGPGDGGGSQLVLAAVPGAGDAPPGHPATQQGARGARAARVRQDRAPLSRHGAARPPARARLGRGGRRLARHQRRTHPSGA